MKNERDADRSIPTIGLLTDETLTAFNFALARGVISVARERGANLIRFPGNPLHPPYASQRQANVIYDLIGPENVDGLVLLGGAMAHYVSTEEVRQFCQRYRPLPMVSVALPLEGIPSVLMESYQGTREAIIHLVEVHGYRRIAFIRGPEGHPEAEERFRAYTETIAEYGIPFDAELVAPGEFAQPASSQAGRAATHLLLDDRGVDLDAIVAANDFMAIAALEILHARGIRVPDDVAVVGFDDNEEARAVTPPLTTARQPMYEVGRRAAEAVLAQMEGQVVPELMVLPTRLVVRQSCGCLPAQVIEAAVEPLSASGESFQDAQALHRDTLIAHMEEMAKKAGSSPQQAALLGDAFAGELQRQSPGSFLTVLNGILRQALVEDRDVTAWQGVLSALRRHTLPHLADREQLIRAENMWQQARTFIAEATDQARAYQEVQAERQSRIMREIGHNLVTTFDVGELTDLAARELPRMGISSCYLALYEKPPHPILGRTNVGKENDEETLPEWSRLILAYDGKERIELETGGRRFPSRWLVPADLLPRERRYVMIVEPLYFQEDKIGFAVFESGSEKATACRTLRSQFSSALKGAQLVRQGTNRASQLQIAAEVSHTTGSILDPDKLIQRVTDLVCERFNLFCTGLFLIDQTGEWTGEAGKWAILRAHTSGVGQNGVEPGHRQKIDEESLIGRCITHARASVESDWNSRESIGVEDPSSPSIGSEAALPLKARGQIIGAMTVRSRRLDRFDENTLAVLQTVADHVAMAISNARLFEAAQRELTERKRVEKALRESEARYRSLFEDSPISMWEQDFSAVKERIEALRWQGIADFRAFFESHPEAVQECKDLIKVTATNNASLELYEAESKAELLTRLDQVIAPEADDTFISELVGIAAGQTKLEWEGVNHTLTGEQLYVRGRWSVVPGHEDTLSKVIVLIEDITARKRAEEKLKETVAELERSNEELEQFAYVTSHDLQEPLRMITSYLQLLERRYKGQLDESADDFIAYAVDGAQRMRALINDLLKYSRVGTRGKPFEPVDCTAILNDALANLEIAIEESGAVVTSETLPTVMADDTQLTQLFQNLIGNAIKFRNRGTRPEIHVGVERHDGEWQFAVRDNGIGIDPQNFGRIFKIFQRLHTRGEYEGTGIGLAVCKRIVERHGGRIWVESEPGEGSTFKFSLPVR